MVGSINFGTDESVSKPVLSRRSRRLKLISEDDFEQRVLFDLQQTKGKSFPEVQEAASDNTEKEKSITNAQQNELGVNEPYTSPQQTPSDGMEAVSARNEETRNEFGLNTGLDLEKQREFVVSDKEESVKTPHTGKDQTHLTEQKTLADTDPELEYRAEKFTEDPHGGDRSMDHELEMPKDTEQNLSMQVSQESTMVRYSEGIVVGDENDKTGEGHEVNDGRAEDGETGGILANTGRMEYAEEGGEKAEGAQVDNGSVEAEDGENIKDAEAVSERMQGAKVKGTESSRLDGEGSALAGLDGEGSALAGLDGEDMAGGDTDDERMEETESDGDIESDEMDEEELMHNDGYEGDDSEVRQTFQLSEKALKSSPLLTTPHFLKILGRQARKPLAKVRGNPKKPTQKRKKTILPSSFVKSVFTHYAKMRVKKEVFRAVDQCLELYFKQLCDDMDVYSKHAKRRTIEKEDLELLMKRQGFITAKTPLNVLIENHLPMECREKLIPMAVSGSKIIPKK
ncbi:centromere protein T [Pristis pectinata]|uniref:centromere protein T n=1 Tax=Pristis pectinata TaxID=685728 RepID=UPI00223D9720|nr:centromere protein T [Pristis pectinata]